MKRWAVMLGCVLGLLGGCSDGDSPGDGSGGTVAGSAGSGGSGTGGAGGTGGGSSTAGTGSGGSGGTSAGGAGGSGGASGAAGGGGAAADTCGSRGLPECPDGSFCNFPQEADCGRADGTGVCTVLTDVFCSEEWDPVCGCDGMTYSNACSARQGQASIDYAGECGAPQGGYDCVLDNLACLVPLPACEEGFVPSADGACIGPCVPIEECACQGPDDCPNPETYACHLSAGHCGPYTN